MRKPIVWLMLVLQVWSVAAAEARVLIVTPRPSGGELTDALAFPSIVNRERNRRLLGGLISSTGAEYTSVFNTQTRTEWLRLGQHVWNSGTSAAHVEQFDAVIWLGLFTAAADGRARPDSVIRTSSARPGPRVPFIWMFDNAPALSSTEVVQSMGPADSCGTNNAISATGKIIADVSGIKTPGGAGWTTMAYTAALDVAGSSATSVVRPLLLGRGNGYYQSEATGVPCRWCDSTGVTVGQDATRDTAYLIKRTYPTIPASAPVIVASPWGGGAPGDSTSGLTGPAEGDISIMFSALAVADSFVRGITDKTNPIYGHQVLGDKQIVMAPVVGSVASRGKRKGANGIFPPDTSAYYAIIDSVAKYGWPVTVAYNPDSADTYARDLIKWRRTNAHYAPQVWTGVRDTTAAFGALSRHNLVDVLGRWRKRVAIGSDSVNCVTCGDTSLVSLLRWQLAKADSTFGRSRVSRVVVAPEDDWSPLGTAGASPNPVADSVFMAMVQAGYTGVVSDAQDPDARGGKSTPPASTNPRGFYNTQRVYRSATVPWFNILCHSGFPLMGGRAQYSTCSDSVAPYDSGAVGIHYQELWRAWMASTQRYDDSADNLVLDNVGTNNPWPYWVNNHMRLLDHREPVRHGNVVMFNASDFSGVPNGPPAANGYHVLKSLGTSFGAINRFAGRTIVRFGYLDEVAP